MAQRDPAYKAYIQRTVVFGGGYMLATAAATFIPRLLELGTGANIAFAILPAAVLVFWVWAFGKLLTDLQDEYLRMLEVRKALIATGITLAIAGGWGLVELGDEVPRLPVFFIFPLWCVGLAIGELYNRLSGHGSTPL